MNEFGSLGFTINGNWLNGYTSDSTYYATTTYTPPVVAEPENETDDEPTNEDWLDERIDEMRVKL